MEQSLDLSKKPNIGRQCRARSWNNKKIELWSSQWFGANITSILYLGRKDDDLVKNTENKDPCRPHPSFPPFLFVLINIAISIIVNVSINVGIIIVMARSFSSFPLKLANTSKGRSQAPEVANRDNVGTAQPRHDGRLLLQVLEDILKILWSVTTSRVNDLVARMPRPLRQRIGVRL